MRALLPFLAAGPFVLLACGGPAGPEPTGGPPVFRGLLPGDARVRAYTFEGAGRVPWTRAEPPAGFPFGELGLTPATRVYLPCEDLAAELRRFPGAAAELRSGPGCFGRGAWLAAGGALSLALAPDEGGARAHTLEFAWNPSRIVAGELCEAPEAFRLAVLADGRLRLELVCAGSEPAVLVSKGALQAGRWNRVGLVVDRDELRSVRLLLEGVPVGRALPEGARIPPWNALVLRAGADSGLDELRLSSRAANSAELERQAPPAPRPRERLTVELEDGPRTFELWSAFRAEPRVAEADDWARAELAHAVHADGALRWTPAQWRWHRPDDPPLARTTHPVVTLGGGKLLTFSGETRDTHLGPMRNTRDTWLFDTRAERWERVTGDPTPPGRCHQLAAYSPEHDLVLLSGGLVNERAEKELLADAWVFHVGQRRWERRSDPPARFSDAVLVWHATARRFVVLTPAQAWTYDPGEDRWEVLGKPEAVDAAGQPAEYRLATSASAVYEPRSQRVFLYGGQRGPNEQAEFVDECLWYELESNRYVRIECAPVPAARVRAGLAHDPRSGLLLLYGGVRDQDSRRFDDLWSFDPATLVWRPWLAGGAPTRRGGYMGFGHDEESGRFFLLGGRHDRLRFLEEVWSLDFDLAAQAEARLAFDRAQWPEGLRWFAEVEDGALEALSFRGSQDGVHFGPPRTEAGPERFLEVRFELPAGSAARVRALGFR